MIFYTGWQNGINILLVWPFIGKHTKQGCAMKFCLELVFKTNFKMGLKTFKELFP